jgi:tetratricopeptide (TPR) repeat protein
MNRFTIRGVLLILALLSVCSVLDRAARAVPLQPGQEDRDELRLRLREAERKLRQGDGVGALMDVEAVLSRDDRFWEAYWTRGQVLASMGDDLGARDSLVRAAELDPGNAPVHFLVASLALRLADFDTAWYQLLAAAQAGHDPAQVQALARQLEDAGQDTSALAGALAAPRVAVLVGVPDSDSLSGLGLELRTLLLEEPSLGLVKEPEAAEYELELQPVGAAASTAADAIVARLREREEDEVLLEQQLPGTGAAARVQLADLVAAVAEVLSGGDTR